MRGAGPERHRRGGGCWQQELLRPERRRLRRFEGWQRLQGWQRDGPPTGVAVPALPHLPPPQAACARKTALYLELAGETKPVACVMAIAHEAKARGACRARCGSCRASMATVLGCGQRLERAPAGRPAPAAPPPAPHCSRLLCVLPRPCSPAGLPVAVATGGNSAQVTKSLSAVGLLDGFFDAVVTACDITPGNGKPHPGEAAVRRRRSACAGSPSPWGADRAACACPLAAKWLPADASAASHCPAPPHPAAPRRAETFLRAAELMGVEPQHCVGYEDAPLGMQAIAAGARAPLRQAGAGGTAPHGWGAGCGRHVLACECWPADPAADCRRLPASQLLQPAF